MAAYSNIMKIEEGEAAEWIKFYSFSKMWGGTREKQLLNDIWKIWKKISVLYIHQNEVNSFKNT